MCHALATGDEAVRQVVVEAGRALGIATANLVGVLSVRRILFAGSVACLGPVLLGTIRQEVAGRALEAMANQTEIGMSRMGPDIVILGASALVLTRELGLLEPLARGM